nr:MAG TPA: hypothetical protein [Caudoviricetes sp.]
MQTMRFNLPQLEVSTYPLEKGMDVVICQNERKVTVENQGKKSEEMYEYDGNIFRTFKHTQEEISQNPSEYLDYAGDEEPTAEMTKYANEMVDAYTEQLILEGVIS